jgi:hypothetical protein
LSSAHFCFHVWITSSVFAQDQPQSVVFLSMPPGSWDHRHSPSCQACRLRWMLVTVCLDWPWTMILLVSISHVAEITGRYNHVQLNPGHWICQPSALPLSWFPKPS